MQKQVIALATALLLSVCLSAEQTHETFDPSVRYSQLVINSNIHHYHCNTSKVGGLGTYNASTGAVSTGEYVDSRGFDYVPGLVVKAILEAVSYYSSDAAIWADDELKADATSWYKSAEEYGNRYASKTHDGASLDDLNACKIYFGLADLSKTGAAFENSTTASNCATAKTNTLSGLSAHNTTYAISSTTSQAFSGDETYTGGWWHKSSYANQLWCDGQYMGPALLAMMVAEGNNISGTTDGDWAIIRKQFDMCWNRLWDSDKKLLYHAFAANPSSSQTTGWADQTGSYDTNSHYGVSSEFWGRAEGWYFFALVDILEQMDKAGKNGTDADYVEFKRQLEAVADGLLARQDATTGCWCQLLQYANGEVPTDCSTKNYIESSCTAIYIATFLKGIRLGYLSSSKYQAAAKKAYQGFINNFLVKNTAGEDSGNEYSLIQCCASAGLDDGRNGTAQYYLAEVGDKDTKVISTYTEGKVLGAFILAAVEYERAFGVAESCNCLSVSFK